MARNNHLSDETLEIGIAIQAMREAGFGETDVDEERERIRHRYKLMKEKNEDSESTAAGMSEEG